MVRKGFSIIEVVVSSALLLLLMGVIFSFLIPTVKASMRNTTRVELQETAVLAVSKLTADLQNTSGAGLGLYTDAATTAWPRTTFAVGLNPVRGATADGLVQWMQQIVVYSYRPNSGLLIRKVYPDPPGAASSVTFPQTSPLRVFGTDLQAIAMARNTTETVVATNVVKFFVWTTNGSESVVSDPVYITLRLEHHDSAQRDPQSFELTRTVSMRQRR